MLSKMSYSIEDLPVPIKAVKALTESEASAVEGGMWAGAFGLVVGIGAVIAGTLYAVGDSLVNGENSGTSRVIADAAYKVTEWLDK